MGRDRGRRVAGLDRGDDRLRARGDEHQLLQPDVRPLGRHDSGGIVKGLLADLLGAELASHASYAIDCAGDLRVGGAARLVRPVNVASPFEDGRILHTFQLRDGGIATSGIGRRSWLDADGEVAHHLLDPASGRPAFTGIAQATALAPTAFEAEWRAKAALLAGPDGASRWLAYGGLVVCDDGSYTVLGPRSARGGGRTGGPAAGPTSSSFSSGAA